MSRPMFYLIDGHAVAYRQFHGLPVGGFTTKSGEPVNAVYGFTRKLMDIIHKEKPKYIAVSFDQGLSGRDEVYEEYKATRDKVPEDLEPQLERLRQVVGAFNVPILEMAGKEADDVIGTITRQAVEQGVHVRIITGDRDLLQLLNEHVTVELPAHRGGPDQVYDVQRFMDKYTIRPDQLVDQKAMMGDSSDNIPGIAGVGEKTAIKLLAQYDTLQGIYQHADEISGRTGKLIREGEDLARMSQKLARIQTGLRIDLVLETCVSHDYDEAEVYELFEELQFNTLRERLQKYLTPQQDDMFGDDEYFDDDFAPPPLAEAEAVIVRDEAALDAMIDALNKAEVIAFDAETTSLDQMQADLVGLALAVDGERGYYVPVGHNRGKQLSMRQVLDALRPPLTNPDIRKVAHNAAYDLLVMQRHGIDVQPITFDTMIAEWLRDPMSKNLGLKNLAMSRLNVEMTPITKLIGTGKKQKTMDEVSIDQVAPYAANDAAMTHRLQSALRDDLEQDGLLDLFHTLEIPLVLVIVAMERAGIALDVAYLREMSERLSERLAGMEQEIFDLTGGYGEFNINSPKQLNDVLYGKLGLPVQGIRKTTHGYSTDAATLDKLFEDTGHPIVKYLLEYRELSKLKGTYVDALPELINPETGRLHTSYNQTGTSTGRLSSSNPNLQNIPIRTEVGREVRRAFIAPPGKQLLSVDYSQIELRVLAHISQDETLLEAFAQNQDIHATTAAIVYDIDLDKVTYEQRSFAKRVNFGLIYGMGAYRLARDSELTLAEANRFIDTYFERLPRVQDYIEDTKRAARDVQGLKTLFGRRRVFEALTNDRSSRVAQQAQLRAAINMPIQGTAADIMKRAMIDVYDQLQQSDLEAEMILQVHDELLLEVPEDQLQQTCDLVVRVMEAAYELDAPLKANAQAGQNWRDMTDI